MPQQELPAIPASIDRARDLLAALLFFILTSALWGQAQTPNPFQDGTGEEEVALINHGFVPELTAAIQKYLAESGLKNTIYVRVPAGESCVEASRDRARAIADIVQKIKSGPRGAAYQKYQVRLGYRTGYGGAHTYTILEIHDSAAGKDSVLEVDDYLGASTLIWTYDPVNWSDTYTHLVWSSENPNVAQPTPSASPAPLNKEFEACVEREKNSLQSGVDWFPKIRSKDAFSKFSCQPMHSAQEYPPQECCDTYYKNRNLPDRWEEEWLVLQECGWKTEIKKRAEAYYKKAEECSAQNKLR